MSGKIISWDCVECKRYVQVPAADQQELLCPHCRKTAGQTKLLSEVFQSCPLCHCRQFYREKNFPQRLGCLIMLIGIILVPFTYGLSLPIFALIDWLIFRRIPNMAVCYRCGAEFHGFEIPVTFKSFLHPIGMKYDKYRNPS